MLDMKTIKMSLKDLHLFGDGNKIIILDDMLGPVDINNGTTFLAKTLDISNISNENELAKTLYDYLTYNKCNAIAFYSIDKKTIRFGSIEI